MGFHSKPGFALSVSHITRVGWFIISARPSTFSACNIEILGIGWVKIEGNDLHQ